MKEKIDYMVMKDKTLTRDQIKEWLQKDIQGVYILLSEILRTNEVLDAMVNVFYERYQHQQKLNQVDEAINEQK